MSEKTKLLNRQVHRTLIIQVLVIIPLGPMFSNFNMFQAIGPFTAGQLPAIVLFTLIFLKTENNYVTVICSGVMAWIPVFNPIAAMFIISPYRKRIISMIKLKQQISSTGNFENNKSVAAIYTTNIN